MKDSAVDTRRGDLPGQLAGRVRTVDDDFSAFVRARMPSLLRAAYLLTGDQHLAEDLVQSALARTHLAWRRLREAGNAEAYARKTMYHAQVSMWRRRRPAEALYGEVPEPADPCDQASSVDLRLAVRTALDLLTPKQRAILVLRFFEDRGLAETADLLDVSLGTVKSQTNYALGRLRALAPELGNLASEVEVVDLEPRIRRTSRRISRRRTAAAIVAVVVAVGTITGAVIATRPGANMQPAQPTPSTSGHAGRLPPPSSPIVANGCPGVSTESGATSSILGILMILNRDDANHCAILSMVWGRQVDVVALIPFGESHGPRQTVVLSPDGNRIAWITHDNREAQAGDLAVVTVWGEAPKIIGGGVSYGGGASPLWEPDSRHLLVVTKDGAAFRVDTTTGLSTPATRPPGEYITYSSNGTFKAYRSSDNANLVVARADGTVVHSTAYAGPRPDCACGFSVHGVSDDGRFVVVGDGNIEPGRVVGGRAVVDATTGTEIKVPVTPPAGSEISQVVLRSGGGMLVVTRSANNDSVRVHYVSPAGVVSHQASLPELTGVVVASRP